MYFNVWNINLYDVICDNIVEIFIVNVVVIIILVKGCCRE